MNMLFYTAFVATLAVTNGLLVQPPQVDAELNDSALCTVCELVVDKAVELLHDGDTEAEIEKLVKRVCDILPGAVKTECNSLVDKYGEKIISMLADSVDPHKICELLKVCSSDGLASATLVQPRQLLKQQISTNVEDKSTCNICQIVVNTAVELLGDVAVKARIINNVKKAICEVYPKETRTKCDSFLDDYGYQIINLLVKAVDDSNICSTLGVC